MKSSVWEGSDQIFAHKNSQEQAYSNTLKIVYKNNMNLYKLYIRTYAFRKIIINSHQNI